MKVVFEKYATCDDWFYMYINDSIIRIIHVDDMRNAPWNEIWRKHLADCKEENELEITE